MVLNWPITKDVASAGLLKQPFKTQPVMVNMSSQVKQTFTLLHVTLDSKTEDCECVSKIIIPHPQNFEDTFGKKHKLIFCQLSVIVLFCSVHTTSTGCLPVLGEGCLLCGSS